MAKSLTSVIGVDIGRHSLKSVLMQRKGANRYVLTHFASQPLEEEQADKPSPESLGRQLKALLKEMGGSAKACAVAISNPDALIRIVDQPDTPTEVLREALRINGASVLNQDCKNMVLDCAAIATNVTSEGSEPGARRKRYLVAGLPRTCVAEMSSAFEQGGIKGVASLQLAPISVLNAFAFAQEEVFASQAFFLLDIGHVSSTMLIGAQGELVLIRNIDFGGKTLIDTLSSMTAETPEDVLRLLDQEEEVMVENARLALMALTREIGSSIGFFEGRRDQTINKVWVSGGPGKNRTLLRVLAEELQMPCVAWNASERCEVNIGAAKRERFDQESLDFGVACGAAAELLKP